MVKWKKVGVVKISRSGEVFLLAIYDLPDRWLIADVDKLGKLVNGKATVVDICEAEH